MTYQVLARRWRPQRFEDLVGQDVVVRTLRNALSSGEVAHAYLFSGLRGVGKTTAARLLAKALNCDKGPTPEPCGQCPACTDIAAGSAVDVLEVDAASTRGIDAVRELREIARLLPVRDRYRVFILDEAHQITSDGFNALLKILEEPPAHVVFILASTAREKFPATILSRCQQLDFRPIPIELIVSHLAGIAAADGFTLESDAAQLVARAAEGSLRDALSLLDRVHAFAAGPVTQDTVSEVLGLPSVEVLLSLWSALEAADVARVLAIVRQEEASGRDPLALYDRLVELLQALLLLACDPEAPVPFGGAQRQTLAASAAKLGAPLVLRLAALAIEQRPLVGAADRPGAAVAVAIGRLALWPRLVRVEHLLAGEPPAPGVVAASGGAGSAPTGAPPAPSQPPPASSPAAGAKERLSDALAGMGEHVLAARIAMAAEVGQEGDELVLRFANAAAATLQSLRDAGERLAAAARAAGLPERVRLEGGAGNGTGNGGANGAAAGLRAQVEADDAVQRVLKIFGGRIESVGEL